jgi:hypothetical protein
VKVVVGGRTTVEKTFDCLAYKDRVQSEIYQEIKDLSFEEEQRYFERRAEQGPLGQWWKRIKAAGQTQAEDR